MWSRRAVMEGREKRERERRGSGRHDREQPLREKKKIEG